jgi:hypothetical protein
MSSRVAVIQAAPVFFDREATVARCRGLSWRIAHPRSVYQSARVNGKPLSPVAPGFTRSV